MAEERAIRRRGRGVGGAEGARRRVQADGWDEERREDSGAVQEVVFGASREGCEAFLFMAIVWPCIGDGCQEDSVTTVTVVTLVTVC